MSAILKDCTTTLSTNLFRDPTPKEQDEKSIACVAAGQFLEGEGKDRLPGFLMFFNTAPFLKLLRQPIRREIINTLLNSIKLN